METLNLCKDCSEAFKLRAAGISSN
ncbi:hypothetical protein CCACVL1_07092 [Corchorus capsularis]|uniref:Uncharacterized protein n=1 Tax=Corchorus capsularis TaxID=210143 RepID=A0A1R3J9J9_COCAP|nr:hypothetical protein CCACVL1_07092 [Corchorus capsularis]